MAIIKDLNSSYGCVANYHKIFALSINYNLKKVIICVASFISKDTRMNNCEPIDMVDIEVPIEDFILFKEGNTIENAYNWLKNNLEGFEDCIDDFESFDTIEVEEKVEDYKDDSNEY